MKKTDIVSKITRSYNKVGFQLKKHSPEILIAAGVVGVVTSAVMACRATTKAPAVIEKAKKELNDIHADKADETIAKEYTDKEYKKDITIVYAQAGVQLVKLYAPSVILGTLSLTGIVASNQILRKRNVALAAAYATVDKSLKEYRGRVVERFGKEVDRQLRYNIKTEETEDVVVDEEGNQKIVKRKINHIDPEAVSGYARFFEEYTRDDRGNVIKNPYWEKDGEYNLMFLKAQQKYANDLLVAKGRVFLNEVYEMLGMPQSKAGQVVGWVYDKDHPNGDNYIDFGIYASDQNFSDFVYGNEAILLDFNVDGNIWDLM